MLFWALTIQSCSVRRVGSFLFIYVHVYCSPFLNSVIFFLLFFNFLFLFLLSQLHHFLNLSSYFFIHPLSHICLNILFNLFDLTSIFLCTHFNRLVRFFNQIGSSKLVTTVLSSLIFFSTHPSIHFLYPLSPVHGCGGAGAYPSCHRAQALIHPG